MISLKIADWKKDFARYCTAQKKSDATIKTYWGSVECFVWKFNTISLDRIHWKQIADYILQYDSSHTIEQKKYAIQLFYGICFGQWSKLNQMPNPKREKIIPQILNVNEICKIILSIQNIKQRCAIQLAYDCALRISEVINIRIKHIDFDRNFLFIHQSKGAKDRTVPFTNGTKNILHKYLAQRFPVKYIGEEYLFDGQENFFGEKKEMYSAASLRAILHTSCRKNNIIKKIKFHTLRHSKATHLHNSGVMSLRDLADFLGHSNTKTTEIYLHTQNEDLRDKVLKASEIIKTKFITQIATYYEPAKQIIAKPILHQP